MGEEDCKLEELSKVEPYASLIRALRGLEMRIAELEKQQPINNAVMTE
jgi:hypothetical protein